MVNKDMKTCAIIIAAYDCAEYIIKCINSVKNQYRIPGWHYDLRIGVDGCKKTADVLKKNKIKFYWSKKNVGAYIMRNSLINFEKADIYSYFDADDVMLQGYIRYQINIINNVHQAVLLAKYQCDKNLNYINRKPIIETGGAMAFTHEIWEALGGYYGYRCAGDTDFMERLKMAGFKIYESLKGMYLRRRHPKSLTKSGVTRYGGAYRKKAWKEMCWNREQGIIKIKPTIVGLEEIR
jgi:glycosyltransferase involved in cell wall biosynthesis